MKQFGLIAVLMFSATLAQAQGVKAKKAWAEAEGEVNKELATMNTKCGGSAKADIDKKSFGNDEDMINTAGWCQNTLRALADLCGDADYKEAVKGIKTVSCKYDSSLKGGDPAYGNKFELKDGRFAHTYNKDSANMWDKARAFLKDNL